MARTQKTQQAKTIQRKSGKVIGVKITKDMTIGDVISKYPRTAEVLQANGVHCVGCHVKYWESLEGGFKGHGMTDEQVDFVLSELNKVVADDEAPGENNKEFVVTKQAAAKLRELFMKEKKENYGLRISVVPGGCSGYSYGLEFENKETKEDKVLKENGVKIIIDNESLKMIKGSKLDFVDTLQGSGFKITNPNAVDSCGCGQSFR